MIAAESRPVETPLNNSGRRKKRSNKQPTNDDNSPLVYLHHARNVDSTSNMVSQLTPEAKHWLEQLTPVLCVYDYDCKDIIELIHQCNYDSAKIQAAVELVYEERQGHEQDEWQTKRRVSKKTPSAEISGEPVTGKRNYRKQHNNKKTSAAGIKIDSDNIKQHNKFNQNSSKLHGETIERQETTKPSSSEENSTGPQVQTSQKRISENNLDTTSKGTWAKVVGRPQPHIEEELVPPSDNPAIEVISSSSSSSSSSLPSTGNSKPNVIISETTNENFDETEQTGMSTAHKIQPVLSPRGVTIPISSTVSTSDVVLPVSHRTDDVVLPYVASNHRDVKGLKFGNITKPDSTTTALFGRSNRDEIPVVPPGLVAEPRRDYNFQQQSAPVPQGFHQPPIYDTNQTHRWDRNNMKVLDTAESQPLEGSNTRRQQNLKGSNYRRGNPGVYRNSHYATMHQYSYEDQYNWSGGNYVSQTFSGTVPADFGANELDAHAAAAAAVLKSQQQGYSANYFPYGSTPYDNSHLSDENASGYYTPYGTGHQQQPMHTGRNVPSSLGQHRQTKGNGHEMSRRNSGSAAVGVQGGGGASSVFNRNGYGPFNSCEKGYEYLEQTHQSRDREKILDPPAGVPFRQQSHHVPAPQNMVLLGSGMQRPRDYPTGPYAPHSNYFYEGNNNGDYNLLQQQQQQQHIGGFPARTPGLDHVYGTTAMYAGGYGTTQYPSSANAPNRHL